LDRQYEEEGLIGGEGHVVEIDETKIGKRKYNTGGLKEGTWVLGMIDRDAGFRLEICPDNKRDHETLLRLIQKHIRPNTTIITDKWKGYIGLQNKEFGHMTVNHRYNFVDPDSGAHTQTIESSWRPLKHKLTRSGLQREDLGMHYRWANED
jgi:transposase-like protein